MTDTDATRRRHRIADPLRELVCSLFTNDMALYKEFIGIADQIDRDHERRMEQAREDSRKHTCNYLSRIIADYKRGKKWKRKEYPNE